ncbi:LPXTG cell wall anchor domain-containing protein [Actinomyces sp.]|uniref:LPXTG cell wall anchor domain-containing protein n=1 Tax=Actinomyces sp. TaxID=29317 RepID=UPI002910A75F|nr:LPXTG cell wall anchor domain-containing protein [Actinomyces sp.]MDU6679011.1 LPXTG cell wall anchor domain-containing protein [Actinomyces sp.]
MRTRILVALVSVIALLGVMFVMPATGYADPTAPEVETQTVETDTQPDTQPEESAELSISEDTAAAQQPVGEPAPDDGAAGQCPADKNATTVNPQVVGDLQIEIAQSSTQKDPNVVNSVAQRYTGETFKQHIGISNTAAAENVQHRIYLEFSSADGYALVNGSKLEVRDEPYYQNSENKLNPYYFRKAEGAENTYYIEVPGSKIGEAFSVDLETKYDSPASPGGTARIWGAELTTEQAQAAGNTVVDPGCGVHAAKWDTVRDEYQAVKSQHTSGKVSRVWPEAAEPAIAYNAAKGVYELHNLRYKLYLGKAQDSPTLPTGGVGQDPFQKIKVEETFTVPEGFEINPDYIQGIRDGLNSSGRGGLMSSDFLEGWTREGGYVNDLVFAPSINGKKTPIFGIHGFQLDKVDIGWAQPQFEYRQVTGKLSADGRTLTLSWYRNKNTATRSLYLRFADDLLVAKKLPEGGSVEVSNGVGMTAHYTHSDPKTTNAEVTTPVKVAPGKGEFVKTAGDGKTEVYLRGQAVPFTLSAKNVGSGPLDLATVKDDLPTTLYMTPAQVRQVLDKPESSGLSITISNIVPCDAKLNVQVASGGTAELSPSYNPACTADPTTVQIKRAGDSITFKVGNGAEETLSAAEIESKLAAFAVRKDTAYSLSWAVPDGKIYGGNELKLSFNATVKDTYIFGDPIENDSGEDVKNTAYFGDTPSSSTFKAMPEAKIGKISDLAENEEANPGQKIDYSIRVQLATGSPEGYIMPLIDELSGPHKLLARVDKNPGLSGLGLTTKMIKKVDYYVLDKPGTYENVTFELVETPPHKADVVHDFIADHVEVGNESTRIQWYVDASKYSPGAVVTAHYSTLVDELDPSDNKQHYVINTAGNSKPPSAETSHPISRQYVTKNIVTKRGGTSGEDELVKQSPVRPGESITYRVSVANSRDTAIDFTSADVYDALPKSLPGKPWTKDDISVEFPDGTSVQGGQNWSVSQTPPNGANDGDDTQQYIVWGDDFKLSVKGEVYAYITLKFPDADDGEAYVSQYLKDTLYNNWHVKAMNDGVSHFVTKGGEDGKPANAALQKGVLGTGNFDLGSGSYNYVNGGGGYGPRIMLDPNSDSAARTVYSRSATDPEGKQSFNGPYALYYVSLFNDGGSRLYLNDIQDMLPKGVTYRAFFPTTDKFTQGDGFYNPGGKAWLANVDNFRTWQAKSSDVPIAVDGAEPKNATITALADATNPSKIIFKVSNGDDGQKGNLAYDEERQQFYLNPNELLAFSYIVLVGPNAPDDFAVNNVAMPYDDVTGQGVDVNPDTSIKSVEQGDQVLNDGERFIWDNEQASNKGFSPKPGTEQWLASNVSLTRDKPVPGIEKSIVAKTSTGGERTEDPTHAAYADTLHWQIKAFNDAKETIEGYVVSDLWDPNYLPTGEVKLSVGSTRFTDGDSKALFTFGDWTLQDGKPTAVQITAANLAWSVGPKKLVVDGDPVAIMSLGGQQAIFHLSLTSTSDGRIRFDLRADKDSPKIGSLGYAVGGVPIKSGESLTMEFSTKNPKQSGDYPAAFNTAFFTLLERQDYDPKQVKRGENTEIDLKLADDFYNANWSGNTGSNHTAKGLKTIKAEAMIPIGSDAFTSSIERVEEVSDPANAATSTSSPNYITLKDASSTFRYSMEVKNNKSDPVKRITMISNLPYVGDNYTFASAPERNSAFPVRFADKLNLKVEVVSKDGTRKVLPESAYRIEYSDQQEPEAFTAADWAGDPTANWSAKPTKNSRSIRLVLNETAQDSDFSFGGESTLALSFDANVAKPAEVNPDEIAWSTFGYNYQAPGSDLNLSSIPLKVGVKVTGPAATELPKTGGVGVYVVYLLGALTMAAALGGLALRRRS